MISVTRVLAVKYNPKRDPNQNHNTVTGVDILYLGEVATPTGSLELELIKLMINSVLSQPDARCACFDMNNLFFDTPLGDPEYV